jgi:hypothetical protein
MSMAKALPTLREYAVIQLAKTASDDQRALITTDPPALMGAGRLSRPFRDGDQLIDMTQPFGRERAIQAVMELEREIARRCRAKFPAWRTPWRDEETNATEEPSHAGDS